MSHTSDKEPNSIISRPQNSAKWINIFKRIIFRSHTINIKRKSYIPMIRDCQSSAMTISGSIDELKAPKNTRNRHNYKFYKIPLKTI